MQSMQTRRSLQKAETQPKQATVYEKPIALPEKTRRSPALKEETPSNTTTEFEKPVASPRKTRIALKNSETLSKQATEIENSVASPKKTRRSLSLQKTEKQSKQVIEFEEKPVASLRKTCRSLSLKKVGALSKHITEFKEPAFSPKKTRRYLTLQKSETQSKQAKEFEKKPVEFSKKLLKNEVPVKKEHFAYQHLVDFYDDLVDHYGLDENEMELKETSVIGGDDTDEDKEKMLKMKKLVTKLPMFVSVRYNKNGREVKYSLEKLLDKIEERSAERINGIKEVIKDDIAAFREVMKADNSALKDSINNTRYVLAVFMGVAVAIVGIVVRYYSVGIKDEEDFCPWQHPPGNEIYREQDISFWEVDGNEETEKNPSKNNNLSCLLTLPSSHRHGYGKLLIDLSYQLSKREHKIGSPEHPLSDLGLLTYRNYWKSVVICYLRKNRGKGSISLKEMSIETGVHMNDLFSTILANKMLSYRNGSYGILAHKAYFASLSSFRSRVINPELLVWQPEFEVVPCIRMNSYVAD